MAMSPDAYRDARMRARDHVQARILERWPGGATVKVTRVFRGPLRRGTVLDLDVALRPLGPPVLGEPLYADPRAFARARYVEAFLDGDPPRVEWEQIKFLRWWTWGPSGDPSASTYDW